jgi:tRNA (adenine22-N1)-methyltransferase
MFSKRIKLIASLITKKDKILDVGTDHALLPIYLIKNNICSIADGSDISENVLEHANKNINRFNLKEKINLFKSNGLKEVEINNYNTLIICGMGYTTIKDILLSNDISNINKLIIQTNNDYELMRKFINSISYKIDKEICIKDKNINYIIFVITKGIQELSKEEYICGIYDKNNTWYYKENMEKLNDIIKNIPLSNKEKINELNNIINIYSNYITKEKIEEKSCY